MASQEYIKIAQALPPRLLRFFARYPPAAASYSSTINPPMSTASITSSSDPNVSQTAPATPPAMTTDQSNTDSIDETLAPTSAQISNPFARSKNPITGNSHDPRFSLRRQAELFKLARDYGVEDLLPESSKSPAARLQRRAEGGLRVKGTGEGHRVKGKAWERMQKGKLEKRRQAMLGMPQLVQTWKQLGHGRGWKKWPK